ncbi:MAG: HNH endonuclease [Verrucomicrobiales bacterium]|nr:HNH endonuclease [Verrucomicrobiales bacterium]
MTGGENDNSSAQTYWLGKLANLNVSPGKKLGPAPHKPLLLLVIVDMASAGTLESTIRYGVELTTRFRDLWPIVLPRRGNAPDIRMPFYALGGERDSIWEPLDEHGRRAHGKSGVINAKLDGDFFALLRNPGFRKDAMHTLISTYFTADEQVALYTRYGIKIPDTEEITALKNNADNYKKQQSLGRSARFKTEVVFDYYYSCALTGYRFDSDICGFVQAAHIHPLKNRGPDTVENGLALSPDAHWLFDRGLWSIDEGFRVRIAHDFFTDSSPAGRTLLEFENSELYFHPDSKIRPSHEHLNWHFKNVYVGNR